MDRQEGGVSELQAIIAAAIIEQKNGYLWVGEYSYGSIFVDGSLDLKDIALKIDAHQRLRSA